MGAVLDNLPLFFYFNNMELLTLQYIIVAIIVLSAWIYAIYRIIQTIKHSKDKCYGCAGCTLHDEILKKQRQQSSSRPRCYRKASAFSQKNQ
jgi:hypothetical protein